MPDKGINLPSKETSLKEIFQGLMEIGEVVENEQTEKKKAFQSKDNI